MKKYFIFSYSFLFVLAGCATLLAGTTQSITVDTVNVQGARCSGIDKKGRECHWPDTPSSTTVQKGDGPMTLTCKKKGYKKTVYTFDEVFHGATLGNIILGGGIGIFVDMASGAAQEYPTLIRIPMEPEVSASAKEKAIYEKVKKEIAEQMKKQEKELNKDIKKASGDRTWGGVCFARRPPAVGTGAGRFYASSPASTAPAVGDFPLSYFSTRA